MTKPMHMVDYINRMNQIYGNGEKAAPRYNTQQYLQGGRVGYQSGQLVQPGPGRQGYGGKGSSSPTYRANLLENLPDGYLEDYKANFYNTIEDGKLTHRGGAQPPSVKGSLKKGIPFMMEKYGKSHGKIADTNSALKASFQSQIKSGAKMGYDIRIGQLRAVAPWNPKAPPGMETHHFLPKVPMEGSSINFASTRNTAFISKELNRKMSPYDKKLKAIQLEQIKLLKEKKPDWEKKINELNFKAKNTYKDAAKNVPDSKGYLGYSQMKIKPDGSYTVEITGLDSSLSLSGKDPKKEIFYRNPKTFEPISREDKLKVNKMSNIKSNKNIPKIVKQTELVSFPANFKDVKWGKNLKGWRGGTLFEVLFGTLDYWNEKSKGKEGGWGSQSMATAIQNASFGLLKTGDKKYEHELIKLGKEMGFDTTALEHVIDMNKRDNVLAKVESSHASHLEAIKKKMDETTDPEMKEKLQEIYNERKMKFATEERLRTEDTNKIFDTFVENLRATKAGPPQLVSPEKLAATGITQEEADAPFKNIWTTAQEQLKREKTKAFPEASKRLDYEAGVIGDPLQTHIFNKDAWKKEHEAFGYWNKTPKQEERAHLDSLIKLAEEGNPEPLKEYNERRGVYEDQPVTRQSVKNLTEQYPWLGYRIKEAKGGRVSFKGGKLVDKGRRAFMKWLAGITGATIAGGTGLIKLGKGATKVVPQVTEEVIKRSADGTPLYIADLIKVVKARGIKKIMDSNINKMPDTVHSYKGVDVVEDAAGETTRIKKEIQWGSDRHLVNPEIEMSITKGKTQVTDEGLKTQKSFKEADEFQEASVMPDRDGKMKDVDFYVDDADHLKFEEIANEAKDLFKVKKASGGLASYDNYLPGIDELY